MTRKKRTKLEMGHDAFLDIVANLVGILIILVVILGTQSQTVIRQIEAETQAGAANAIATDQQLQQLAQYTLKSQSAQADSLRFEKKIERINQQIEARSRQRGQLLDLLAVAEAAWEESKHELDANKVRLAKLNTEIEELQSDLVALRGESERLAGQEEPVVAIQHLPTPMAKTVFGEEVHFRLKENRLSVVPIDKLLSEIRRDFSRVAAGPREGHMDGAVGPIRGYVARYVMDKRHERSSLGRSTQISLDRLLVEPLSEPYGERIETVLSNGQTIDIELAGRQPGSTTVTVWVYPDSFGSYRKLQEMLYTKGYATAARVLASDQPITGSSRGSRSIAQ